MQTLVIAIPTDRITDWDSFHEVFQSAFGFPDFYGRNMDAWIDCMSDLDEPRSELTRVKARPGELVALRIDDASDLRRRCPDQYTALIECSAFVNYRQVEGGRQPLLALMLVGRF
jgi:RNAse (barnase) inhibitor barstar